MQDSEHHFTCLHIITYPVTHLPNGAVHWTMDNDFATHGFQGLQFLGGLQILSLNRCRPYGFFHDGRQCGADDFQPRLFRTQRLQIYVLPGNDCGIRYQGIGADLSSLHGLRNIRHPRGFRSRRRLATGSTEENNSACLTTQGGIQQRCIA